MGTAPHTTTPMLLSSIRTDSDRRPEQAPANYRVGRDDNGIGFAYRNFIPAAHMPFSTSTRQLRSGFYLLTDTEAAQIALNHLDAAIAREQSNHEMHIRWAKDDTDRIERTNAKHAAKLVAFEKARAKYQKLTATTTHESQEDTMASTKTDAPKPPARRRRAPAAAPAATDAPASKGLQEYQSRRAAAAEKRTTEAEAVAERAAEVKAEQDAAPAKPKRGPSAEQIAARDAKKAADAERVAKVIEMRKAGKKLSEIAAELGYTSQQVVSGVLRRHAPELQTQREAGTGGLTLTPEQVTELQAVEAKFGAKLTTLARALARATA